jgi:hypothetical protein
MNWLANQPATVPTPAAIMISIMNIYAPFAHASTLNAHALHRSSIAAVGLPRAAFCDPYCQAVVSLLIEVNGVDKLRLSQLIDLGESWAGTRHNTWLDVSGPKRFLIASDAARVCSRPHCHTMLIPFHDSFMSQRHIRSESLSQRFTSVVRPG